MANEGNLKPFKKGYDKRRNLEGRPKDISDLRSLLMDIASKENNGQTVMEAIIVSIANQAMKGNLKAGQIIMDYLYGKPTQKTEIVGQIETNSNSIDLKKLTLDELRELERIATKINTDKGGDS